MKKIKTNTLVSCIVLSNKNTPLRAYLEKESYPLLEEGLLRIPEGGFQFSMRVLYDLQSQIREKRELKWFGLPKPIKIVNCFVHQSGSFLKKPTALLILHFEIKNGDFPKIKNKYLIPKFRIKNFDPKTNKFEVEFTRFGLIDIPSDIMSTRPTIFGTVLKED